MAVLRVQVHFVAAAGSWCPLNWTMENLVSLKFYLSDTERPW
jgi:hypothetical protein